MIYGCISDIGLVREKNQDSYLVRKYLTKNGYIISDEYQSE